MALTTDATAHAAVTAQLDAWEETHGRGNIFPLIRAELDSDRPTAGEREMLAEVLDSGDMPHLIEEAPERITDASGAIATLRDRNGLQEATRALRESGVPAEQIAKYRRWVEDCPVEAPEFTSAGTLDADWVIACRSNEGGETLEDWAGRALNCAVSPIDNADPTVWTGSRWLTQDECNALQDTIEAGV